MFQFDYKECPFVREKSVEETSERCFPVFAPAECQFQAAARLSVGEHGAVLNDTRSLLLSLPFSTFAKRTFCISVLSTSSRQETERSGT